MEWVSEQSLTPHPTQYRSFRRRSSQPIWLTLTNKAVQENKHTITKYKHSTGNKHAKTKYKSDKVNNLKTAKQNYPGSVASYNTRPGNKVGLFYNDNTHGALDMWKCLRFLNVQWPWPLTFSTENRHSTHSCPVERLYQFRFFCFLFFELQARQTSRCITRPTGRLHNKLQKSVNRWRQYTASSIDQTTPTENAPTKTMQKNGHR